MISRIRPVISQYANWLGSSHFLDTPVLLTFFFISIGTNILVKGVPSAQPNYQLLGQVTLVTFVLTAALVIVRFALSFFPLSRPKPGIAVGLFLIIAVTRYAWLSAIGGTPTGAGWKGSVGIAPIFLALGTAAIVTAMMREQQQKYSEAQSAQLQLKSLASTMQERIEGARRELLAKTNAQLEPTMQSLRSHLSTFNQQATAAREITTMLANAVSDLVRPMSHNLAEQRPQFSLDLAQTSASDAANANPLIDVRDAISPGWLTVTGAIGAITVNRTLGFPAAVVIGPLAFIALSFFAFRWLRMNWPAKSRFMTRRKTLTVLAALYLLAALAQTATWLPNIDVQLFGQAVFGGIALRLAMYMGVTLLAIASASLRHATDDLERNNEELSILISTLKRELWLVQRNIALTLHGSLQSALVSSQILLSKEEVSETDLTDARERIEQALARLDAGYVRTPDFELALAEISGLWRDSVHIEVRATAESLDALRENPGLTAVAAEIVRESVGNAVRHGGATEIDLNVQRKPDGLIQLELSNNGAALPADTSPGLGTRLLEEVTHSWSRLNRDGHVVVTAVLA